MDETKKDFMPAAPPPGWKLNPKYIECRIKAVAEAPAERETA